MNKINEYNMKNTIKVDKDGTIGLDDALKGTNVKVSDVHYYELENGGQGVKLTVYDKDKKQIKIEKLNRKHLALEFKSIMKTCRFTWFPKKLKELIEGVLNE